METIIAATITAVIGLIGIIITVRHNNQKILQEMKAEFARETQEIKGEFAKSQAVIDVKIEELTREVREHNDFAKRMPAMEAQINGINEKINILHSN